MKKTLIIILLLAGYCVLTNSAFAQLSNTYTIINKSGVTVKAVYVAPAGTNNWSDNISTVEKIGLNEGFQYALDADKDHCNFDFKFVDIDGKTYTMPNMSLCTSTTVTLRKNN